MLYNLTPEKLDGLLRYLNREEGSVLDPEAAQAVLSMASAIGSALMRENRRVAGENGSLRRRLERVAERNRRNEERIVEEEAFEGTGLDSVDVARGALYCLQQCGYYLTKDKFFLLVYLLYCSFLFNTRKRLFLESPEAVKSRKDGRVMPLFWKVAKGIASVTTPEGYESWKTLADQSPMAARYVSEYLKKHGDESEESLRRFVLNSAPVRDAIRSAEGHGAYKWAVNDKDIVIWRESIKK